MNGFSFSSMLESNFVQDIVLTQTAQFCIVAEAQFAVIHISNKAEFAGFT